MSFKKVAVLDLSGREVDLKSLDGNVRRMTGTGAFASDLAFCPVLAGCATDDGKLFAENVSRGMLAGFREDPAVDVVECSGADEFLEALSGICTEAGRAGESRLF